MIYRVIYRYVGQRLKSCIHIKYLLPLTSNVKNYYHLKVLIISSKNNWLIQIVMKDTVLGLLVFDPSRLETLSSVGRK